MQVLKERPASAEVFAQIQAFYTDYMITLDELVLDKWPDFFEEKCLYRVTARENWEAAKPLSAVRCETRGMLIDRVVGIQQTMMFAPRSVRHFQSALKVTGPVDGVVHARSNFLCVHTLIDEPSEVAFCGVSYDKISVKGDELKFIERICVLDTEMIRNSMIYPL